MIEFFLFLGIMALAVGAILVVFGIVENELWLAGIGLGAIVIGLILVVSIAKFDKPYALANNLTTEYGVVKDISGSHIIIDQVSIKYDFKTFDKVKDVKIGDIVQAEYAEGEVNNYIVDIQKYEGDKHE